MHLTPKQKYKQPESVLKGKNKMHLIHAQELCEREHRGLVVQCQRLDSAADCQRPEPAQYNQYPTAALQT